MLRKVIEIILCIVLFVLQITVFKDLQIASVSPNLILILIASIGFMRGKNEGMLVGVICGLFVDIYFSPVLGLYTFLYMLVGYLNGCFKNEFFPNDIKMPMILIGISTFLFNTVVYFLMFFFRGDFAYFYYLMNIIIPEIVYTLIISFMLYPLILKINGRIETYEKRNASKYG